MLKRPSVPLIVNPAPSTTAVSPGALITVMDALGVPPCVRLTRSAYTPPRTHTTAPGPAVASAFEIVRNGAADVPGSASEPPVDTKRVHTPGGGAAVVVVVVVAVLLVVVVAVDPIWMVTTALYTSIAGAVRRAR